MQTVNFNCSHCKKLMAVGMNLLGRNVRCPHCKQVVMAPATAGGPVAPSPPVALQTMTPAEPNLPTFVKPQESHESIFGEVHDEDVFGTRQPKVQMPSDPNPPPVDRYADVEPTVQVYTPPYSANGYADDATQEAPSPISDFPPMNSNPFGSAQQTDELDERASPSDMPQRESYQSRSSERESRGNGGGGGGVFIWMVLLWAVAATGVAGYFYWLNSKHEEKPAAPTEQPYSAIPDFFGYYDKAERKKPVKIDKLPEPKGELPKEMMMKFGESLQIGDLEVAPVKVEYGLVGRHRKPTGNAKLVKGTPLNLYTLHLRVKNISEDVVFHPTDPFFNSRIDPRKVLDPNLVKPYTGLSMGKDFFMGGPFFWPPLEQGIDREYLEGQQEDDKPLGPGQERTIVIASDVDTRPLKKAIEENGAEPITWRVQLRRGLVPLKDPDGNLRDVSMTCVVGVVFHQTDIVGR